MSIERRVALIALILSALILWAALAPLNRSVYLFPIFWASFMVVLSIVLLWRTFAATRQSDSERPGAGTLPLSQAILRLAPAIGVFVSYLFLMANLGFYVSAWLAFVALACWYGPRALRRSAHPRSYWRRVCDHTLPAIQLFARCPTTRWMAFLTFESNTTQKRVLL
jgi:CDP-diglyceride synthetase